MFSGIRRSHYQHNNKPNLAEAHNLPIETREQRQVRLRSEYENRKRLTIWLMKEFQKQGITHKEGYFENGTIKYRDTGKIPRVPFPNE